MQTLQICTNLMDQFLEIMRTAICNVPVAPLRKEPSHRSEMTSQLLFGETMEVLEEKEEWLRIRNTADGYEGWLTNHLVEVIGESMLHQPLTHVAVDLINPVYIDDQLMNVPMGSSLTAFNPGKGTLWKDTLHYKGASQEVQSEADADTIEKLAFTWLHAPYLWGGKTIFGVDCSGFVQTVFKMAGIPLQRDAYQQAGQGTAVNNMEEARKGDVAFFQNEAGKVTHVGIVLDNHAIIHAAGKVRVDTLNKDGIIHKDSGKRTHQFHSVRRFLTVKK
jgi:cell wall-associated NlpC family hydrolase